MFIGCLNNKKISELIRKFSFSLSFFNLSRSQVSLVELQTYLSFLDGYACKVISLTIVFRHQLYYLSDYVKLFTIIEELVMFCDLLSFVQSPNANQLYIFRQTICSKQIHTLCKTDFSDRVIDIDRSLITFFSSACVCFDWLIELVCSLKCISFETVEFRDNITTGLYINKTIYKKLKLSGYDCKLEKHLEERHKQFFLKNRNVKSVMDKLFLFSVVNLNIFKCLERRKLSGSISEFNMQVLFLTRLAYAIRNCLFLYLAKLLDQNTLNQSQDCLLPEAPVNSVGENNLIIDKRFYLFVDEINTYLLVKDLARIIL